MRVALVHEYLTQFGGAERVLEALMELFPNAPVFTLVYDTERLGMPIDARRLRTSFLQRLPGARRSHRYFPLGLMPLAVEQFDLTQYDLVVSASHSFGKGVITGPRTLHISYCFTPTRYAWDNSHQYVREFSRSQIFQRFVPLALGYIRMWDYYAAQRVNTFVTLSQHAARRIKKYYSRSATVIHPPVDIDRFTPRASHDNYYLVVSRLLPYKRVDLAIDACEKTRRPLKVVGVGPEAADLHRRAGAFTEFLGFVPDDELPRLYAGARALLFPQEEDFGITTIEAAASGKPTIAFRAGGARETIIEGETGVFFAEQSVESLAQALERFDQLSWNGAVLHRHAQRFGRQRFLQAMDKLVQTEWTGFQNQKSKIKA
jgi:glycosyltransferase involved in cell wall biosynthesis